MTHRHKLAKHYSRHINQNTAMQLRGINYAQE